jgi:glycerol-3-phosphate dehydrogenase subunit C
MEKAYTIRISRFNPETDSRPVLMDYRVPCSGRESVLGALLFIYEEVDSTLLFNYGCRYRSCGKCAMKIDGKPKLACETPVSDGMVLEPLDRLPVIRDLAVDRTGLLGLLGKHHLLLSPKGSIDCVVEPPEFFQVARCNECLSCLSVCPAFGRKTGYDGPFIGAKLAGLHYDLREQRNLLDALSSFLEKCIQCKQCQANCPWEVPFAKTAATIRGELFRGRPFSGRDWLMARPPLVGYLASLLPVFRRGLAGKEAVRKRLDHFMGIDQRAPFPGYHKESVKRRRPLPERKEPQAAYFLGCYDKFNDQGTAKATLSFLEERGVETEVLDLGCCGQPFIGIGDLNSAKQRAEALSEKLERWIRKGCDVLFSCPSCASMVRDEYPSLFGLLSDEGIRSHLLNLGEFLWRMHQSGQSKTDFKETRKRIGYHAPCHLKAQKIGTPFIDLLKTVPGLEIEPFLDKCCGMAGTMGFKKEKFDLAQEIGRPLFDEIRGKGLDLVLSDCAACRMKIEKETGVEVSHPIVFLSEVSRKRSDARHEGVRAVPIEAK